MKAFHQTVTGHILRTPYVLWMTAWFLIIGILAALIIVSLPGESNRRRAARLTAYAFFLVNGLRPRVSGRENLIRGPSVVVSNHGSYLDGILLTAVLPPRFGFVIKNEMTRVPVIHAVLRRLGSIFVDRTDPRGSSRDAMRIFRKVASGRCMGFFAEGTFKREPGLRPFKPGAFITAARLGVPVIPVAIRGSRDILPERSWWPRWHRLEVEIGEPIEPPGRDRADAMQLRAHTRASILAMLDEPDLEAITRAPHEKRPKRAAGQS